MFNSKHVFHFLMTTHLLQRNARGGTKVCLHLQSLHFPPRSVRATESVAPALRAAMDENDTTVSLERLVALERDNALMLSFILDTRALDIQLPLGTSVHDVNYGAVDVPSLVERLRRQEKVDLRAALTESASMKQPRTNGRELAVQSEGAHKATVEQLTNNVQSELDMMFASEKVQSMSIANETYADPFRNDEPLITVEEDATPSFSQSNELQLPALYSALSQSEVQELAFEIVAVALGEGEQLESIRLALDVDQERAERIIKHASAIKEAVTTEGISARLHLRMLMTAVKDGKMDDAEDFFRTRCRAMSELLWAAQCSAQAKTQTVTDHDDDDHHHNISPENVLLELNRMLSLSTIDVQWVESVVEMIESVLDDSKTSYSYTAVFGMRLYTALLNSIFDQFEDYTLAYDADSILSELEPVALALGLTDGASRKVMLAYAVMQKAIDACREGELDCDADESPIVRLLVKTKDSIGSDKIKPSVAVAAAANSMLAWAKHALSDFMKTVSPPAQMDSQSITMEPDAFGLLVEIAHRLANLLGDSSSSIIRDACRKSALAEYYRLRVAAMDEVNVGVGEATCTSLRSIADSTAQAVDLFSAHLERHITRVCPSDVSIAGCFAAHLGHSFRNDLYAWLESGPELTVESLETIWSVGDLQNALVAVGGDMVEPLALEEHTSILVFTWLNAKIENLNTIADRCVSVERWRVTGDASPVPSAVDILRAVNETLDGFFRLKIPAHVSALRALTEGIDAAVRKYSNAAILSLGPSQEIVPAIPTMTRYKKSIVDELRQKFVRSEPPRQSFDDGCVGAATLRLISLKFLMDKMYLLEKEIIPKWKEMQRAASLLTHPHAEHSVPGEEWFEGMMAGARQALRAAILQASDFMAYSVIYRDLSAAISHNIYAQGVHRSSNNLSTEMLPYLNDVLGYIAARLDGQSRNIVADSLLKATVSGWMRVLLNGGAHRVFILADAELLEEEIEALSDFFHAGGHGLETGVVSSHLRPLSVILSIMSLPTDQLCQTHDELKMKEESGVGDANSDESLYNSDTILRVLCHRAEHSASKWIKAHFSIGKTESGSMFSSFF